MIFVHWSVLERDLLWRKQNWYLHHSATRCGLPSLIPSPATNDWFFAPKWLKNAMRRRTQARSFFSHYPGLSKFSKKHVTKQDKGLQAAWNSVDFSQKWNMLAAVSPLAPDARCQNATHFPSLAIAYRLPGQSAGTVVGKRQHLLAFQDSGQKWETKLYSNFWYVVSMNSSQL